jgi:hypothetical protein
MANERASRPSHHEGGARPARDQRLAQPEPVAVGSSQPVIDRDPVRSDAQRGERMKAFPQCICVAILLQRAPPSPASAKARLLRLVRARVRAAL